MGERPRLGARDLPLALRMTLWRVVLPVARRALPADRLVRRMASRGGRARDTRREALVLALAGRLWRRSEGTCLERSLAAYRELGRAGALPQLVLGIAKEGERLAGHSWVELDGTPAFEQDDPRQRFTSVAVYDHRGRRTSP